MAHYQQNKFIDVVRNAFPDFFKNKRVLEIGSWDVNGNIRNKFINCNYIGVDVSEGKGVDIVCEGQNVDFPTNYFDVVISCECFEHNRYWLETFTNMIRMLKPGGLCLITCATIGRGEHGTKRRAMDNSLTTRIYSEDYYINLDKSDFTKRMTLSNHFGEHRFFQNIFFLDLYFIGIKKGSSYPMDLGSLFLKISENVKKNTTENDPTMRKIISKRIKFIQKYIFAKLLGEKRYHNLRCLLEDYSRKLRRGI
jgi:SAM-dependent methyltransferase